MDSSSVSEKDIEPPDSILEAANSYFMDWLLPITDQIFIQVPDSTVIISLFFVILLLMLSALISGSEVAYFSLTVKDLQDLYKVENTPSKRVIHLLNKPRQLLATILIANNLFNVGIVIISYYAFASFLNYEESPIIAFMVNVVGVTFILVLFGEVLPKIYATQNNLTIAKSMSIPLLLLQKLFKPVSIVLVSSTQLIEKKLLKHKGQNVSLEEINHAIDLTADESSSSQELKILKGIVKFGNISVKQIMRSRLDMVAAEEQTNYSQLMQLIAETGYSRIPVYRETLDQVIGILYVKDLLAHLNEEDRFQWQQLIRTPYFAPENMKIDILLKEMQSNRMHMAVVVDEYGGTSGIITLEDIVEEVIGEINDEFDDSGELDYQRIDKNNFIFEGRTLLNDFFKIINNHLENLDEIRGDAESVAGLLIEVTGKIPSVNEKIKIDNFLFTILSLDKNRIDKVQVTILEKESIKEKS